ncbi:hypothetical protein SDC9_186179 [bioreactor metagenome]|uniref:Uncharacterized protein n=1 Tax=bioreactor metagenome TaxID=1076179 RepID=A0A645HI12_9ZZZZ
MHAADEPYQQRRNNGHEPGRDQLFQSADGSNIDAPVILGHHPFHPLFQAFDRFELTVDFGDHALCIPVDSQYQHCTEYCRNGGSHQEAEKDIRIHDIEPAQELFSHPQSFGSLVDFCHESPEQGDDGQSGCCDGEAFGHCFYRVAGTIE